MRKMKQILIILLNHTVQFMFFKVIIRSYIFKSYR